MVYGIRIIVEKKLRKCLINYTLCCQYISFYNLFDLIFEIIQNDKKKKSHS